MRTSAPPTLALYVIFWPDCVPFLHNFREMSVYDKFLRPLLFRFDPERVHNLAMTALSTGVVGDWQFHDSRLEQTLFGVSFMNPIGLAAGFDKNAVALGHWHHLGFGSVEVGTITFHAQSGNPKPRLFRLPRNLAIINRMGFNNDGAERVARRMTGVHTPLTVGVNLGKSKVTELAEAARDYQESFRLLKDLGRYFVINVSSPNTPGLRTLQDKGPLLEIAQAIREVDAAKPLFVKVAPDLELAALDDVLDVAREAKLTGIIATNTTLSREGLSEDPNQAGGLSGLPLREKADAVLGHLAQAKENLILIGVGGIFSGRDVFRKIALGAHLTQVYTGWIYGGPEMVAASNRELVALMEQAGIRSLAELRGSGANPPELKVL